MQRLVRWARRNYKLPSFGRLWPNASQFSEFEVEVVTRRILHILGSLQPAGIETWLLQVLRHIDRERFHMDFLLQSDEAGAYAEEARALGSLVVAGAGVRPRRFFARNFARMLSEHGLYDIVHSHQHFYNGFVMRLAASHGVQVRIAHSHSDTSVKEINARFLKRDYHRRMRRWIDRHATAGLAASRRAAPCLFGPDWQKDPRWRVLYCGIDLLPFRAPVDRTAVRAELGLPADALVIGHVGRFQTQKNHEFLMDVFAQVVKRNPGAHLLLVGDGPLRPEIEQQAAAAGIGGKIVFTGVRRDVPRLMAGAMDIFLLPSLREGLGLVLIEAQAAGLPCVISDVVPDEADVVPGLIRRMPLDAPAEAWAESVLQTISNAAPFRIGALNKAEASQFNIRQSVAALEQLYESEIARQSPDRAETRVD